MKHAWRWVLIGDRFVDCVGPDGSVGGALDGGAHDEPDAEPFPPGCVDP